MKTYTISAMLHQKIAVEVQAMSEDEAFAQAMKIHSDNWAQVGVPLVSDVEVNHE